MGKIWKENIYEFFFNQEIVFCYFSNTHIHREQEMLTLSHDIQAAFNRIDPKQVKKALLLQGGDPTLFKWYYNYITLRNLHK